MSHRIAVFAVVVCGLIAVPASGAITVSLGTDSITAEGLTPGAGAVVFSIGHEAHRAYYTTVRIAEVVPDGDGDGRITYKPARPVAWKSLWFVVDARSGAWAVARPEGFPDRLTARRTSRPKRGAGTEWSELEHERGWLELLLIRPGGDVWTLSAMRGGDAHVDRSNAHQYRTPVEKFVPLTPNARPLKHLSRGDVVIAIDAKLVEYFLMEAE